MTRYSIIVIGASAGGVQALSAFVRALPREFPAALFIVVHMSPEGPSFLSDILGRAGPLPVSQAVDGEAIRCGHIYVARPNCHLVLRAGYLKLSHGPRENRYRPAIDTLFRSAARAYGSEVVGVVLTGLLDDGTAGLLAIKAHGGLTIVQDPLDAAFPDMPRNALRTVDVDHCLPLVNIPPLLASLVEPANKRALPLRDETKDMSDEPQALLKEGKSPPLPSGLTCPSCHGALFETKQDNFLLFECRVGHTFGLESLLAEQDEDLENALWGAVRALEESAATERRIAARMHQLKQAKRSPMRCEESAADKEAQAKLLRKLLLENGKAAPALEEED